MGEKKEDVFGFDSMIGAWTDAMNAFWGGIAGAAAKPPSDAANGVRQPFGSLDAMGKTMKTWQTMASAMSAPGSVDALLKGTGAMPQMLAQLAQSAFSSVLEMHQKGLESAGRIGASVDAYRFENIDENIFRVWTDVYEKEFRQFFRIPQLGLARTYQEKLNTAVDAYNRFQAIFSEFLRLLTLPFNRALSVMQDQMSELAEKGELPEDAQVVYRMWIKVLEGHFMTLFQTPEYNQTLGKTITALASFSEAKDAVLEDMLRGVPVASRSEMDDLAREVYELKKRIRRLEASQKRPDTQAVAPPANDDDGTG